MLSMRGGGVLLVDEISLADDSVLERLNSVLEPSRSLVLAEKGGDIEHITASEGFTLVATMNPAGDYGKKEVSHLWFIRLRRMRMYLDCRITMKLSRKDALLRHIINSAHGRCE